MLLVASTEVEHYVLYQYMLAIYIHWYTCMLEWCGTISMACPKSRLLTQ